MTQLTPKITTILSFYQRKLFPLNTIFIDQQSIINNFKLVKKLNPDKSIIPVLKSNAYGHGIDQIVCILKHHVDTYIADSYYEALKILAIQPQAKVILIGSIHPQNLPLLDYRHISLTVQDSLTLKSLIDLNRPISIHLKINTGMNRQGIDPAQLPQYLRKISNSRLGLEGVYSHLSDADNPSDASYTQYQYQIFNKCLATIKKHGLQPKYIHLSATAGMFLVNDENINTIRLGIGLYGYHPQIKQLKPALTFKASIVNILKIKKGDQVSYNRTFTAKSDMTIGVISAGYFEGIDRRLSNQGFVKYQEKFLPIIGRVCMNLTVVDLTNTHTKLFDQVEVISSSHTFKNSVASIANACQTIPYEILIHLHSSVKRTLV